MMPHMLGWVGMRWGGVAWGGVEFGVWSVGVQGVAAYPAVFQVITVVYDKKEAFIWNVTGERLRTLAGRGRAPGVAILPPCPTQAHPNPPHRICYIHGGGT